MIRKIEKSDLDGVMGIWLKSNTEAHCFIPAAYWRDNGPAVRQAILQAEVYVWEDETDKRILGFIGLQDEYVAGIFVDQESRGKGIGRTLLNLAKEKKDRLRLSVYEKNQAAVRFYEQAGFAVKSRGVDAAVGEAEYEMEWKR